MDQQDFTERLEKQLDKIENKLDRLAKDHIRSQAYHEQQESYYDTTNDRLVKIEERLGEYNASLVEHMRRTDLMERAYEEMKSKQVDPMYQVFIEQSVMEKITDKNREKLYKRIKIWGGIISIVAGLLGLYAYIK